MANDGLSQLVVEAVDKASGPFRAIADAAREMAASISGSLDTVDARMQGLHFDEVTNRWRDTAGQFASHTSLITQALDKAKQVGQSAFAALTSGAERAGGFLSGIFNRLTGRSATPTSSTSTVRAPSTNKELSAEVALSIEQFAKLRQTIDLTDKDAVKAFQQAASAERAWIKELGPNVSGVKALENEITAVERKVAGGASHPIAAFFRGLGSIINGVWGGVKQLGSAISSIWTSVASLPGLVALGGLSGIGKWLYDANSEFQRLSINLTTLLGSATVAKDAIASLIDIETKMPFTLQDITEGYVRLLGLGLSPTKREMQAFANVAVLAKSTIDELALAIRSADAGMMRPLKNQLSTLGVQISNLDKTTKTFQATFHGTTTTVHADAESIAGYIQHIGEAFPNAAQDQMQTLSGEVTNLKTALFKLAVAIGESGVNTAFGAMIQKMIDWINNLSQNQPKIAQFLEYAIDSIRIFVDAVTDAWERTKLLVLQAQQFVNEIKNPLSVNIPGTDAHARDQAYTGQIGAQQKVVDAMDRLVDADVQLRATNEAANKIGAQRVDYLLAHPEDKSAQAQADRSKYHIGSSKELPRNPNPALPNPDAEDPEKAARMQKDLDGEIAALEKIRALQQGELKDAADLQRQHAELELRDMQLQTQEAAAREALTKASLASTTGPMGPENMARQAAAERALAAIERERAKLAVQMGAIDQQLAPIRAEFGARELARLADIKTATEKQLAAEQALLAVAKPGSAEQIKAYEEIAKLKERLIKLNELLTAQAKSDRALQAAADFASIAALQNIPGMAALLPRGATVTTKQSALHMVDSGATTDLQRFAQGMRLAGNSIKDTYKALDDVRTAITAISQELSGAFAEGFIKSFQALGKGSKDAAKAFSDAMRGAIAQVAESYAQLWIGKSIAEIAEAIADPATAGQHLAAAAEYMVAAAAMATLGGAIAGAGGGGGGGGGGSGRQQQTAAQAATAALTGSAVVIWEGEKFDPRDPTQLANYNRMREEVGDRRMIIRTRRGTRRG